MAKPKAPYTKQALYRAAASLRKKRAEVTSGTLYDEMKKSYKDETEKDKGDVYDIGLRVLCGRMTSMKSDLSLNPDLFAKERFPDNFPLRVRRGDRVVTILVETRTLTPQMIDEQPPIREKSVSRGNPVLRRIGEMKAKGISDQTLETYVNGQK